MNILAELWKNKQRCLSPDDVVTDLMLKQAEDEVERAEQRLGTVESELYSAQNRVRAAHALQAELQEQYARQKGVGR